VLYVCGCVWEGGGAGGGGGTVRERGGGGCRGRGEKQKNA